MLRSITANGCYPEYNFWQLCELVGSFPIQVVSKLQTNQNNFITCFNIENIRVQFNNIRCYKKKISPNYD